MKKIDSNSCFGPVPVRVPGVCDETEFLGTMDKFEIERCAVKSTWALFENTREGNERLLQLISSHPDRFVGVAVVNPLLEETPSRIDEYHSNGVKALALYPALRGYSLGDHQLLNPVLNEARKRKLPVCIMAVAMWGGRLPHTDITPLPELALNNPDIEFLVAGVDRAHWHIIKRMKALRNVSIEISLFAGFDGVKYFVEMLGTNRVHFGTGYGIQMPGVAIERVESSDIPQVDKESIFYENAKRLFR